MASRGVITGIALLGAVLAAGPARADDQHRRGGGDRQSRQSQAAPEQRGGERAVQRSGEAPRQNAPQRQNEQRQSEQRQYQPQRQNEPRQNEQRQYQPQRQYEAQRPYDARRYEAPRPDVRRYDDRDYRSRTYDRAVPYYGSRSYGYGGYHGRIAPRIIRPSIVTVVPYRPYVYRPSWSIGIYYGSNGYYPYGYTPRGYYDPIPGRPYGGLRITGVPRDAQVFADGYFVGLVNDFDGVFQHLNLEAGPHHIEIDLGDGYQPIAFDVIVQPGQTTTFRADGMRPY